MAMKSNVHLVPADTPPRSPERSKLAAAVDRHQAAIATLARIEAAIDHASETSYTVMETAAVAEAAIEAAKANADDHLVSIALGEVDGATSPLATTTAELERARNDLAVSRSTTTALEARQTAVTAEIEWSRVVLDDAIRDVLKAETSASVTAMMSKAKQLQAELVYLRVVLRHLLHDNGITEPLAQEVGSFLHDYNLPATFNCTELKDYSRHPAANQWRAARDALKVDADAALPA